MGRGALVELLFQRIQGARSKHTLEEFLAEAKRTQGLPRSFVTRGTPPVLLESLHQAVANGWVTETALASLVDRIEENGRQHIFLFDVTDAGRRALTAGRLRDAFPAMPARPTPALYAELPAAKRTGVAERADGLVVKQLFRAEYWEKDQEKSYETADERATVVRRHERRAINLFIVRPEEGTAEVRVDRVRSQMDDNLAMNLFTSFLQDLSVAVQPEHIEPVPLWRALPRIAVDRDEVYLNADDAQDAEANLRFSNRRARDSGPDIRDYPRYTIQGPDFYRAELGAYWTVPGEARRVYTHMSIVEDTPVGRCGKVYISATLAPPVLHHVLDRIRHFVR